MIIASASFCVKWDDDSGLPTRGHRVRWDREGDGDKLTGFLGMSGGGSVCTEGNNADVNPLERTYVSHQR